MSIEKKDLLKSCEKVVLSKLEILNKESAALKSAMENESKSSAGDKHEVGTAMLHLEAEKIGEQIKINEDFLRTLNTIDTDNNPDTISFGSYVITDNAHFFLSVPLGKIGIGKKVVYAISTSAPLTKAMLGKKQNDKVSYNGKSYEIVEVL